MKKTLTFAAAMGVIALAASSAHASDGTINFTGELMAQTCTIDVNNSGSEVATVALPIISTSFLATAGETAGETPFAINLSGCLDTKPVVGTYFEGGGAVDTTTGRLHNTDSTGATNVELELLNGATGDTIRAGQDQLLSTPWTAINNGMATLPYAVRYYATGTTTPGKVTSTVTYLIDYM